MTVSLKPDDEAGSAVLAPGQRIGQYRLIHPLGEGGMGVVHLALDPNGRAVAIKVLREHIAHDREARNRLRREVETLALVRDARVASVLDADTEGGALRGEALLRLGHGLWGALKAIHDAGVIHRDLKPGNVILLDGDPVVIDFGIAHVADDIRLTMTGLVMGTPGYLSPEVVEGARVTEATDWWGWAATLAFAASGASPFGRGPMPVVLDRVRRGEADLSGVDRRLAPLLRAALSPNPAERPHADELVKALDLYAAGAPATVAIPVLDASPTMLYPDTFLAQARDPALREASEPTAQQQQGGGQPGPAREPDLQPAEAVAGAGPGQPDPRAGRPSRVATMLALLVGVLGVAAIWPLVGVGLVVLWCLLARFTERSVTAVVRRRCERGRRRSDVLVAVVSSPWHALVSVVATALALVIPAIVAVGATFCAALAYSTAVGADPMPDASGPLVAGGLLGLLMCWWGPGGARLQRGSRSLVRALVPGSRANGFVVALLVLTGVGLGAWAWVRHGQLSWWPGSLEEFKAFFGFNW
jgi:hypothetical protein